MYPGITDDYDTRMKSNHLCLTSKKSVFEKVPELRKDLIFYIYDFREHFPNIKKDDVIDFEAILINTVNHMLTSSFNLSTVTLSRMHHSEDIIPMGYYLMNVIFNLKPIAIAYIDDNDNVQFNESGEKHLKTTKNIQTQT